MLDDNGNHYVTVSKLTELLSALPGTHFVMPNALGNLLIIDDTTRRGIGVVELGVSEQLEFFDDPALGRLLL